MKIGFIETTGGELRCFSYAFGSAWDRYFKIGSIDDREYLNQTNLLTGLGFEIHKSNIRQFWSEDV